MKNGQTRKKTGFGLKLTAILLGVVDVLLIGTLAFCFFMKPDQGEAMEAQLPEDFSENAETYWDLDETMEISSEASVNYEADLPEPQAPTTDPAAGDSSLYEGFLFPDSNTVELTDEMLREKITDQAACQRAINEIYARHGYLFTKQENLDYFNTYAWYADMEKIEDMETVNGLFSEIEQTNVEKLQAFQDAEGWTQEG